MTYSVGDLIRSFGRPVVEHARARIESGEVDVMPAGPGARRLFGVVRLAKPPAARVTARSKAGESGALELSGNCTCRAGQNCEHVVAVLLGALGREALTEEAWRQAVPVEEPKPVPPVVFARPLAGRREVVVEAEARVVTIWLERVVSAIEGRPARAAPATEKHRLLYLLDVEPRGRRLTVHPVLAYVRKDGRYGATRSCPYTVGADRPAYMTSEDRELLLAIQASSRGYGWSSGPTAIDAEAGSRLLGRVIATGRCHWQSADSSALRLGDARAGRIEWTLDDEGRQWTRLAIDGDAEIEGLGVEPPWYVDRAAGVAGPLELDLEPRTATALLEAPGLPPEASERVRETLTKAASRPLPLPRAVGVTERRAKPVARLRLHLWRPQAAARGWVAPEFVGAPMAELAFDYDGVSVHAEDEGQVVQRVVAGELLRVRRDLGFEEQAELRLEALGFVALDEVWERGENPSPGGFLPNVGPAEVEPFLIEFGREAVPRLRQDGWVVEMDGDYPFRLIEGQAQWFAEVTEGTNPWFDLELGVEIDGERHSLLPMLVKMVRDPRFHFGEAGAGGLPEVGRVALRTGDGRLLVLPAERVRVILNTLTELFGEGSLADERTLSLSVWNAARLDELAESLGTAALRWSGGERLRELGRKLRGLRSLKPVAVPRGFHGTLRPYQREGLSWLQFLREHDLAGVLADDMGLGKTVQVLAHLLAEKRAGRTDRPSLVVAPTSVVSNWRHEAEAFTRDLRVLVLHGQSRRGHFERLAEHDLVLTTYPLLARDEEALARQPYHALILDEAQFVKNAKTKAATAARRLEARHRLCLTGTPMENHLGELWSLFHFLMPGLLGDAKQFRRLFRTPIEKHDDRPRREQLVARVRPFLLRRTKDQVETELPPKTEMTRAVELEHAQRDLYESIRLAMDERVRKEVARKGLERSTVVILHALLKLRQVCCDPRLLKIKEAARVTASAKLAALFEMLDEMLEEGRRILLFSQFTSMLELIEQELEARGRTWVRITGATCDRDTPVRRFQRGEVPLFLISLKAGGTGLNLTAADTVIHYDPWWNPAVEDQATDRAHRIGQDKPIFVYRLIVAGSVEEKMLALQARKRALADAVYGAHGARGASPWSAADLEFLFQPLE